MPIHLTYIMRRSDWIKLVIIFAVGFIAITSLYTEYQKTNAEYERLQQKLDEYSS